MLNDKWLMKKPKFTINHLSLSIKENGKHKFRQIQKHRHYGAH